MYIPGSHVDLTYLNHDSKIKRVSPREHYERFIAGTKISFQTLSCGTNIMSIVQP